jgi:hypothetical protein
VPYTPFFALESKCFPEREVDPAAPELRVFAIFERRDAVKEETGRPAPYHDVAMPEGVLRYRIGALWSSEQEDGGKSERD